MRDDEIAREAVRRQASHEGQASCIAYEHLRPRGDGNLLGLRGEEAFGERFGLPVDLSHRITGDGGRDFVIDLYTDSGVVETFVVDCKAAMHPKDLVVEKKRCKPKTIYVLCKYWQDEDRCTLIGWQWGVVLMRSTPKDYGYGVINYWWPRGELRNLSEIAQRQFKGEKPNAA